MATLRGRAAGSIARHTLRQRAYRLFVPVGHSPAIPTPLVVMLHGCRQNAEDFAAGTGMDAAATALGCIVLYPEQPERSNRERCWNWFQPGNQLRGMGEPAELAAMVEHVAQEYAVDRARVFVAGLSAGACMAVTLGVVYPDLFAAVGVCAGLPYGAARTTLGALAAMRAGATPRSVLAGGIASLRAERRPLPLIVFHGTADAVVVPESSTQLMRQWAEIHRLDLPGGELVPAEARRRAIVDRRPYRLEIYRDGRGAEVMRRYLVEGMGHAWPGGTPDGTYTDVAGPPASRLMLEFFLGLTP